MKPIKLFVKQVSDEQSSIHKFRKVVTKHMSDELLHFVFFNANRKVTEYVAMLELRCLAREY